MTIPPSLSSFLSAGDPSSLNQDVKTDILKFHSDFLSAFDELVSILVGSFTLSPSLSSILLLAFHLRSLEHSTYISFLFVTQYFEYPI